MAEESYDVVVVGSGYGGSVAACRAAMAGLEVCVIEKGRRWEAQDFPVNTLDLMRTVRMEWRRWGFGLGPKKALFQIHDQDDSLVCVACGLGGGSLINAGVMIPTPVRARRNPKWPKEWEKDWEINELLASSMLGSQSVPVEFPNAQVMRQATEENEYTPQPIKLSINFSSKETSNLVGSQQLGSCLACGNCLSGCPYNAKNSTDKNYLASAIQAGCVVKTECKVLYILKNPNEDSESYNYTDGKREKRWRVYFNTFQYICTDYIVLSAGVLGTTEILFQSKKRGLNLSERLGFGFSCNGNNVAYIAGSKAPLNAYGLTKAQVPNIPFKYRPGPAISSSYISSLGFTIQSAMLPKSYPNLIFKGISTYGWPVGFCLLHGIIGKIKHLMGLSTRQDMALNVIGHDDSDGRIALDEKSERLHITPPRDPQLPKKIQALQNFTKRLGGILYMSRYRSTSVHLLGGCNAALNPLNGVCNPKGQVFYPDAGESMVHEGLYVCDASIIPCSIGANPCLTISTVSEHVSRNLVQDILSFKSTIERQSKMDMDLRVRENKLYTNFIDKVIDSEQSFDMNESLRTTEIPRNKHQPIRVSEVVTIKETMKGYICGMPCTACLVMRMNANDLEGCDPKTSINEQSHSLLRGRVGGYVIFRAISKDNLQIIDGKVDMCKVDNRAPYTQYMSYRLILASTSGTRYIFIGKKVMNPYFLASYAWSESRTLHVSFRNLTHHGNMEAKAYKSSDEMVDFHGELHLSMLELLKSLMSLRGKHRGNFVWLLLQSLWRTYILQVPRQNNLNFSKSNLIQTSYPPSTLHELTTDDGCMISCRQWKNTKSTGKDREEREKYPVLLLNGYSIESFWLPTEPKDLVRTILEEGHDIWLLQSRTHPLHASNKFTIDDIGRFDIPTAITRIIELQGPDTKVHVVAHCVGGLAIHIALLGGYVSATNIASLSCTNSSMYFKLTTSSMVKMTLPLIPVSMAILGRNQILPMLENSKENSRHRLLKFIARLMPRYERCTTDECEIFSGIFGNSFWHENVSESMHQWLNKFLSQLPMSAFHHLRKICTSGFIIDDKGRNSYLIHPERMPLPTLYISGGRNLLVTSETSFLANRYMRLHQPGFQHERVVVEGFGHSDLLIGEESPERVFPHILSHLRLVEKGMGIKQTVCCKETMVSWDVAHDGNIRHGPWGSILYLCLTIFMLVLIYSFGRYLFFLVEKLVLLADNRIYD